MCKLDLSRSPAAVALFELDESAMLREEYRRLETLVEEGREYMRGGAL